MLRMCRADQNRGSAFNVRPLTRLALAILVVVF
jgi:hypothetical protein